MGAIAEGKWKKVAGDGTGEISWSWVAKGI